MPQARNMREVGDRIDLLLNEVRAVADEPTRAKTEELVGLLVEFYGAGLARIVEIAGADEATGPEVLGRLAGDDLVASLLVLHGLHPVDLETRVQQALDKVRPYLGSHAGGVDFLGVDGEGVVHLRLEGSCHGCPSSTVTVKLAIERAIMAGAPEVTGIAVEGVVESAADQVISLDSLRRNGNGHGHGNGNGNGHAAPGDAPADWATLNGLSGLESGALTVAEVGGESVVVCRLGADLFAYRNVCAGCGGGWDTSGLDGDLLACPACGARYDVRLAGRGAERRDLHLDPLPLLADGDGVRIAVAGVAAR